MRFNYAQNPRPAPPDRDRCTTKSVYDRFIIPIQFGQKSAACPLLLAILYLRLIFVADSCCCLSDCQMDDDRLQRSLDRSLRLLSARLQPAACS